jgi:hypothetical protein
MAEATPFVHILSENTTGRTMIVLDAAGVDGLQRALAEGADHTEGLASNDQLADAVRRLITQGFAEMRADTQPVGKTKHTLECSPPGRGPGFRRTPGCPACNELIAGRAPRQASPSLQRALDRGNEDERRVLEIRAHHESGEHLQKCCKGNPRAVTTCYDY